MSDIFVSVDIEADGPVPGLYSMLSVGASVLGSAIGREADSFYTTLEPLPEAIQHPETMEWWKGQPEAWAEVNRNPRDPLEAMTDFAGWLDHLAEGGNSLVFVGYPVAFDWMFVAYYLHRFVGRNPFGFQGLDLKSAMWSELRRRGEGHPFHKSTLTRLPQRWKSPLEANHNALEDARSQGDIAARFLTNLVPSPPEAP